MANKTMIPAERSGVMVTTQVYGYLTFPVELLPLLAELVVLEGTYQTGGGYTFTMKNEQQPDFKLLSAEQMNDIRVAHAAARKLSE